MCGAADIDWVRYLEGTRSHNEGHVLIPACYIYTTVASSCQTLCEQLAGKTHTNSPAHQLAVWCMSSSLRVCTLVLLIG